MRRNAILMLILCAGLVACEKSEVYSDLAQEDANDMLVLLTHNGISAEITRVTRQNKTVYGVSVDPDDLDRSRALLKDHNLPRPRHPGLADIFTEPGFIPTPQEQKARFLLALKGELINALEQIPDVVDADVIVNIPTPGEFGTEGETERPTASVVIKVRPTSQAMASLTEEKVQRFVANAVEKLDPRDVSVVLAYTGPPPDGVRPGQTLILPEAASSKPGQPAAPVAGSEENVVSVAGLMVSAASAGRLKLYLGIFLGILAMLALGLVVMVIQSNRMRQEAGAKLTALPGNRTPPPPQLEG